VEKSVEMVDKSSFDAVLPDLTTGGIGIFVKEPVPGQVKTRLCPPLTAEEAADFYRVALEETVDRLAVLPFSLTLFFAGNEAYFRNRFPRLRRVSQGSGDLGLRMDRALARLLPTGQPALLVGSDSPDLPATRVTEAFAALAVADAVAVPAVDGGYVLIGERRHYPRLFLDIPWSTPEVLSCTRARAAELGLRWQELAPWEDVDDLPSLLRLLERSPASASARHARARLSSYLA
jgi:rSAM/selenodomain-associated transferase 1